MHAQAVSNAAAALQAAAIQNGGDAPKRVLEIGSGCGIICIMLALQRPDWHIEGVEIQPALHTLARQNALLCKVDTHFILGDLRSFKGKKAYDLILSNPPWQKQGSGKESMHQARNISRIEILCTLPEVLNCIRRNLALDGEALLLYPLLRDVELRQECHKSLLDIITASAVADLKEQRLYRIRHKGISR